MIIGDTLSMDACSLTDVMLQHQELNLIHGRNNTLLKMDS